MTVRRPVSLLAASGLVGLLALAGEPAEARVRVDTVVPRGDGSVDLVLEMRGGCPGRASGLAVTMPDGAAVVALADPRGWGHVIEPGQVTWTRLHESPGPARFVITARLAAPPGDTVLLPAVQRCAGGQEVSWSDPVEADRWPAPRFVATGATSDPAMTPVPPPPTSGGAGPRSVAAAVVLATVAGAIGAHRTGRRRRSRTTGPAPRS